MDDENATDTITLATELTIAWLGNPNTRSTADEAAAFLKSMHETVGALTTSPTAGEPAEEATPDHVPAVTVRRSLASREHILSMIDGKPYRTLRRHLAGHGLTPEDYRARYGLKADYPMVAPAYSEARRAMAKKIGLGRKAGEKAPAKTAPARRGRSGGTA